MNLECFVFPRAVKSNCSMRLVGLSSHLTVEQLRGTAATFPVCLLGLGDGSAVIALIALAENPGLIPSTHVVVHIHL